MRAYNRKQIWLKGSPTGKNIKNVFIHRVTDLLPQISVE
jgi:hypothetical protein